MKIFIILGSLFLVFDFYRFCKNRIYIENIYKKLKELRYKGEI